MLAPVPQPRASRRSRRVLVVEDDTASLAALTALLEHAGHRVRSALDGQSGLDLARTFLPEVLVVDMNLPDIDGFAVAGAVKSDPELSGCYVIALTGSTRPTPLTKNSSVDAYYLKAVESETLLAAIERAS
jgi:CheY-like chemotaxis protein